MTAQVAWVELSTPPEKKAAQVAWVELSTPLPPPTIAQVAWVEFEIPDVQAATDTYEDAWGGAATSTTAQVAWVEIVTPAPSGAGAPPSVFINPIHSSGVMDDVHSSTAYNDTSKLLTVSGTAADDVGVARVELSIDGGAVQIATGTTSWNITLNVSGWAPGLHTIQAVAVDTNGNFSAPLIANVWYSPSRKYGAASVVGDHLVPLDPRGSGQ